MGRLFEPVSDSRARLMIETASSEAEQNPAYRFAADKGPLRFTEGVIFSIFLVFIFLYKKHLT